MYNVLAIFLGIAALIVYVAAARQNKPWGTPVMATLAVAAVIAVALPHTPLSMSLQRGGSNDLRDQSLELLGQKLAPRLSPGDRILVIDNADTLNEYEDQWRVTSADTQDGTPGLDEWMSRRKEEDRVSIEAAFADGAGVDAHVVDIVYPPAADEEARAFDQALAPYDAGDVDLVISLIGLPSVMATDREPEVVYQLDEVRFFTSPDAPLLAATLYPSNPGMLQRYLQQGPLAAVVLTMGDGPVAVDADDTDVLSTARY